MSRNREECQSSVNEKGDVTMEEGPLPKKRNLESESEVVAEERKQSRRQDMMRSLMRKGKGKEAVISPVTSPDGKPLNKDGDEIPECSIGSPYREGPMATKSVRISEQEIQNRDAEELEEDERTLVGTFTRFRQQGEPSKGLQ